MSKKTATQKATGTAKDKDLEQDTHLPGEAMTTNQGLKISDDQNSLKAGVRGPTLLEDFHLREKIQHFDHERIPERVVHARGTGAHGYFQPYDGVAEYSRAGLFQDPKKQTPVFVRFSTVAGSRGSADTARDVRGFAVKFYTEEGVWDLVGNNMPVFFIQDAIKFPDLIHAVKPEPHNEIPQAQSAHDTFWDFVSLTPESTHMLMWVMSDRAIPRSLSMMEGFGVHTYRLINAKGKARFVKFHWKPANKIHSLVWDEAQKIAGKDPDFHRRDLWESIERGNFPEWELGVQIVEEKDENKFDFDLLDPTKIIPEELVPVKLIGKMVLNRNTDNFFAETEQAAFHPGHVVPGVDFSNDPLLQGRLFSYLDTQITRIGPNFHQLPINRSIAPIHNNQRDAHMQMAIHKGRVAYFPNSLGDNLPSHSPDDSSAFTSYAEKVDGQKIRQRSPSFGEHFSQATLFWNSMSTWEKKHIVDGFSFELNQLETKAIQERVVNELLLNVAAELAQKVAMNIGVEINGKAKAKPHNKTSAALSLDKPSDHIRGRKIAVLAADGVDGGPLKKAMTHLKSLGAIVEVIAKVAGTIKAADGSEIKVDRAAPNAPSVVYDAVLIPSGKANTASLLKLGLAVHFVTEAYAHAKPIAAIGDGIEVLKKAQVDADAKQGVIAGDKDLDATMESFVQALMKHRFFERPIEMIPA
jgi:catalase